MMVNKIKDFFTKENVYSIGIRARNDENGLLFEGNNSRFSVIPITDKEWYADPIVFSYNGKDYLFCEVFDRDTDIGHIGVTVLDSTTPNKPQIVMNIGSHLSYPCVFEMDGAVYMIPETTTKKNVMLYRSDNFPYDWEYVTDLLSGDEYADTTVYQDDEVSLLMTFQQYQGNGSITKPLIFNAKDIKDGSIVAFDSQEFEFTNDSRGGGKLFWYKDSLLRPSQICTHEYGYALKFNEVFITDRKYTEKSLASVYPEKIRHDLDKQIIGIHTYALTDEYEIIDVKFDNPLFKHQVRRLVRFIGRKIRGL